MHAVQPTVRIMDIEAFLYAEGGTHDIAWHRGVGLRLALIGLAAAVYHCWLMAAGCRRGGVISIA